jgi:hypothetical protein
MSGSSIGACVEGEPGKRLPVQVEVSERRWIEMATGPESCLKGPVRDSLQRGGTREPDEATSTAGREERACQLGKRRVRCEGPQTGQRLRGVAESV